MVAQNPSVHIAGKHPANDPLELEPAATTDKASADALVEDLVQRDIFEPIILARSIRELTSMLTAPIMRDEGADPESTGYALMGVPIYDCEALPDEWLSVLIEPTGDEAQPFQMMILTKEAALKGPQHG